MEKEQTRTWTIQRLDNGKYLYRIGDFPEESDTWTRRIELAWVWDSYADVQSYLRCLREEEREYVTWQHPDEPHKMLRFKSVKVR